MIRHAALLTLSTLAVLAPAARSVALTPATKQSAATAEAPATPLIANGGFEAGTGDTPEGWRRDNALPGVEYAWDRATSRKGTSSWRFTKTIQRYFPMAQVSQVAAFKVVPDRIKVSAWVKASQATKAVIDVSYDVAGESQHQWVAYIGAREAGGPPADHDWTLLEGVADPPEGATNVRVALQMYGPGTVWFDEIRAEATTEPRKTAGQEEKPKAQAAPPTVDRQAGGDARKRYFLYGPQPGQPAPTGGYRLLLVLPGGDGSEGFRPFVESIHQQALPAGYLTAQLVAPRWTDDPERVIWPTARLTHPNAKFTTEQFIRAVVEDVRKSHKLDPRYVFTLGWSSSGSSGYAASLEKDRVVTGSFIAMSVFKPDLLPALEAAKGHRYYLLHSPQDFIPIRMAEQARDSLRAAGAETELVTYEGGHGWKGDPFAMIRAGVRWLEERTGRR